MALRGVGAPDGVVDMRSDTVTRPVQAMLDAMREAKVGDDVLGDDPTVKELEAHAADAFGKEAALWTPSGTMGNLAAIMGHCDAPFSEMIVGNLQHTYLYELGGVSRLAGVHPWVLPNQADGTMRLEDIEGAIRCEDVHHPVTRLVSLENTHNSCGGVPLSTSYMDSVGALARKHGLKVHVDGARVWNAAVAQDVPVGRLCQAADSVTFCLSKGLGAPAGSVLVGRRDFIHGARRARKALGGGLRQVGVLAACGLVSLRTLTQRLAEDHEMARTLATGLAEMPELSVDPGAVKTNILFFGVKDGKAEQVVANLAEQGVLVGAYSTEKVRLVTHYDAPLSEAGRVLDAFRKAVREVFAP